MNMRKFSIHIIKLICFPVLLVAENRQESMDGDTYIQDLMEIILLGQ